ncbi:SET and MYND domain-containing protein 4 [Gryllus bimaculatus]|nr:SET and MYND domain-containing protein 4 [Gryllus bimaculatus]
MAKDNNCVRQWQEVLDKLLFSGAKANPNIEDLRTEEELIGFFMDDYYRDEILKWICEKYTVSSWKKCKDKAKSLREEGNKIFQLKDYVKCLCIYTESIKYAPVQSEELSLSFANRSAVLFRTCNYEGAIIDIEQAFSHGYPQHLSYKLHQRKAECLIGLEKYSDAVTEFKLARDTLRAVKDMSDEKKAQISKSIEKAINDAMVQLTTENKHDKLKTSNENGTMPELPVPVQGLNEDFPYASKSLSLRESKESGRHVVAVSNISVGDILFVEKPFAWVLLPENYQDRCHHCCSLFGVPVPCWECTTVLYCSELCRKDSWNEYHKWECYGGLDVIHNVGVAHLGLRVVLRAGSISELKTLKKKLEKGDADKNERYVAVYNLVTHLADMNSYDRAAYALTAVCLMLYLEHYTEYFTHNTSTTILNGVASHNDESLLIGCFLLHHICQLVCNGHAITAIKEGNSNDDNPVVDEHQIRVATAIFPSASMMNHSCDSNIINSFFGTHLIVKAYKDIQKGQEVFNCYGPHFRRMLKKQRKEHLRYQYFFECQCEDCLREDEFLERFTALLCEECNGPLPRKHFKATHVKCLTCGSNYESSALLADSLRAHYAYQKGQELMNSGSLKEALHNLQACHEIHVTCLYKSHIERRGCLDSIAKCYAELGDFANSTIFIERTLPAIEEQYGAWSIEMAHELSKLTDSMVGELNVHHGDKEAFMKKHAETMKYVQKAKEIFELHYGIWNLAVQDVTKKESYLNDMLFSAV